MRHFALGMLTKFAYPMAQEPLHRHIVGDDDNCLVACRSIYSYARQQSKEWDELLRSRLPTVNTPKTFQFLSFLLVQSSVDFNFREQSSVDFSEDFRPFCTHENEEIRVTAFHSLGRLKNKKGLVELFIVGLDDVSARVVHTTLQALAGIRDKRLLKAYVRVLDRFKTDECHILTNLENRLKEMGIESIEKFHSKYGFLSHG
jgi:hypothetical protein